MAREGGERAFPLPRAFRPDEEEGTVCEPRQWSPLFRGAFGIATYSIRKDSHEGEKFLITPPQGLPLLSRKMSTLLAAKSSPTSRAAIVIGVRASWGF